jgi:hypothetical protein
MIYLAFNYGYGRYRRFFGLVFFVFTRDNDKTYTGKEDYDIFHALNLM